VRGGDRSWRRPGHRECRVVPGSRSVSAQVSAWEWVSVSRSRVRGSGSGWVWEPASPRRWESARTMDLVRTTGPAPTTARMRLRTTAVAPSIQQLRARSTRPPRAGSTRSAQPESTRRGFQGSPRRIFRSAVRCPRGGTRWSRRPRWPQRTAPRARGRRKGAAGGQSTSGSLRSRRIRSISRPIVRSESAIRNPPVPRSRRRNAVGCWRKWIRYPANGTVRMTVP